MSYKVLIAKPYFDKYSPTACKMLKDRGYTVEYIPLDRNYTEDELISMMGDVDAVIADSEPWTEKAMKAAPKLKIIARYGVGMNSVDTQAAKSLGIVCTNCPGINANPVAEHTLALMLGAMRNLENLSRTNKTYLNNTLIPDYEKILLKEGDEIGLGGIEIGGKRQQKAAYFRFVKTL